MTPVTVVLNAVTLPIVKLQVLVTSTWSVAVAPASAASMLTVVSIAHLLKQDWARRWIAPLSLASVAMGVVYLAGLAMGGTEARLAFDYLIGHGGLLFALGLVLMAIVPFIRRVPVVAALVPLAGATIIRSLIVEVGQIQFFGF